MYVCVKIAKIKKNVKFYQNNKKFVNLIKIIKDFKHRFKITRNL